MGETERRLPEDLKPALILHENGQIGMCFPRQDDDEAVPKHVEFIAALMVLMSDPEFIQFYTDRVEKVIQNAERDISGETHGPGDVREVKKLKEEEIAAWDIAPADAAIILTSDWTIHVYAPEIDEIEDEDPVPDHVVGAAILTLLINTDPGFVEKVWELWEKKHRKLEDEG